MVGFFLVLAAPPVQTAGRGRAHLRRGAHSSCKLIFELCAGFLDIKVINPHMFYIYMNIIIIIGKFICMLQLY